MMRFIIVLLCAMLFTHGLLFVSCAKKPPVYAGRPVSYSEVPLVPDIKTFKGLAYVVAQRHGVRWADNVSVIVKRPSGVRLDAIERITDVVATFSARDNRGVLYLPLENKRHEFGGEKIFLPKIGEVDISSNLLADLLVGRPVVEKGGAMISQSFNSSKGSYFINGRIEDVEISSVEAMPLVYTRYADANKKRIVLEADFDEFLKVDGAKFPQHIVIRLENPKMILDIRYKDIRPNVTVPWELVELK